MIVEGNGTAVTRSISTASGGSDNIVGWSDGEGRSLTYGYSQGGAGYRTSKTDAAGAVTSYTPDYAGRVTATVDAHGKTSSTSYSASGFVLSETDELNRTTSQTRNAGSQVSRTDYPDGTYETFTYDTNGQVLAHRLKSGASEANTYDTAGNLTAHSITYNNGSGTNRVDTITYAYFATGLPSSMTDPRGNTTSYQYDWRGHQIRSTAPGGSYRQMAYDTFGNKISETDELGHTWSTTYTEYNEVATSTDPLNRVTSYEYGQEPGCSNCGYRPTPIRITLPSGKRIEYSYDRSGKRLSAKAGAGSADEATTTYAYDSVGNLAAMTDARGKTTTYGYDLLHRKTSETDPLSQTTGYEYDDAGNILRVTRADSTYSLMSYDSRNRVLTTRNPNNEITTFSYFDDGSMASLADARGSTYSFAVDGRSRRTRMTYPGGSHEDWAYDGAGNLGVYTARNGTTRTCTYDARNRDILCDWSDGTPDVSKTYDNASRLLTLNNANSTLSYTYDNANQLLSETQTIIGGPGAKTISYSYDLDGQRLTLNYPSGAVYSYNYTGRNQLSAIRDSANLAMVSYTYDFAGNRTGKTLANGTTAISTFDNGNRLANIDQSIGLTMAYTYNSVNNRTSKTTTPNSGPVLQENYSFDPADQLTGASYLSGSIPSRTASYAYDAAGNRTNTSDAGTITPYTANNLNQYTSLDGLSTPAYSSNGNLTSVQYPSVAGSTIGGAWNYSYDSQNRLLTAGNGVTTTSFAYDARNRQVSRTINGTTTHFIYDAWNLVDEYSGNGNTLAASYLHGSNIDEIVFRSDASNSSRAYYHQDALGNTIALSDSAGNVIETYRYDAFGVPAIYSASAIQLSQSAFGNRFLYTGREWINDLAIYDYRNRQYSPQLGNFLQIDPIRFEGQDANFYRYGFNSVASNIDPDGLSSEANCQIKIWIGHHSPNAPNSEILKAIQGLEKNGPKLGCGAAVGAISCFGNDANAAIEKAFPGHGIPGMPSLPGLTLQPNIGSAAFEALQAAKREAQQTCKSSKCCKSITIRFSCSEDAERIMREAKAPTDKTWCGKEEVVQCDSK